MQPAADGPNQLSASVTVVIASLGRPEILADVLTLLARQSKAPDRLILSLTTLDDLPTIAGDFPNVEWVIGPKGSCIQRNTALDLIVPGSCDIIAFLDDDYIPSCFLIERIAGFFQANPDVAGTSGDLLADGINSPGISLEEGQALLSAYDAKPCPPGTIHRDLSGLYGCNMAFRASALETIRFDERLKLYGWQEDFDFAARVRQHGRIVKTFAFAGVHRGVKVGRTPGVRLGYSQVMNPLYLVRKGTMRLSYACKIVARNVLANHVRVVRPEPWVDRVGRVRGNWIALMDLLRFRITPERVLRL